MSQEQGHEGNLSRRLTAIAKAIHRWLKVECRMPEAGCASNRAVAAGIEVRSRSVVR